jgi:hypothetical protein
MVAAYVAYGGTPVMIGGEMYRHRIIAKAEKRRQILEDLGNRTRESLTGAASRSGGADIYALAGIYAEFSKASSPFGPDALLEKYRKYYRQVPKKYLNLTEAEFMSMATPRFTIAIDGKNYRADIIQALSTATEKLDSEIGTYRDRVSQAFQPSGGADIFVIERALRLIPRDDVSRTRALARILEEYLDDSTVPKTVLLTLADTDFSRLTGRTMVVSVGGRNYLPDVIYEAAEIRRSVDAAGDPFRQAILEDIDRNAAAFKANVERYLDWYFGLTTKSLRKIFSDAQQVPPYLVAETEKLFSRGVDFSAHDEIAARYLADYMNVAGNYTPVSLLARHAVTSAETPVAILTLSQDNFDSLAASPRHPVMALLGGGSAVNMPGRNTGQMPGAAASVGQLKRVVGNGMPGRRLSPHLHQTKTYKTASLRLVELAAHSAVRNVGNAVLQGAKEGFLEGAEELDPKEALAGTLLGAGMGLVGGLWTEFGTEHKLENPVSREEFRQVLLSSIQEWRIESRRLLANTAVATSACQMTENVGFDRLRAIMSELGARAEFVPETEKEWAYAVWTADFGKGTVVFLTKEQALSLNFTASGNGATVKDAGTWNSKNLHFRTYLNSEGNRVFASDFFMNGGVCEERVEIWIKSCLDSLRILDTHV